jgi:hypothetical protein
VNKSGTFLLITVLFLSTLFSRAQTNLVKVFIFTNRIVSLTNLAGIKYENIELIRADFSGIVYINQTGAGGGVIRFTNLPDSTLENLGLVDFASAERENSKKLAEAQKQMFEAEKEQMRDRSNYKTLHLTSYGTFGNSGLCTIREFPTAGTFLIYNAPKEAIESIERIQSQSQVVNELNSQITAVATQIAAAQNARSNLKAEATRLKDARAHGEALQANQLDNANYAWNIEMDRKIEANSERQHDNDENLDNLSSKESSLNQTLATEKAKLESLQNPDAGAINAFISRISKYQANPVIFCSAVSKPSEERALK